MKKTTILAISLPLAATISAVWFVRERPGTSMEVQLDDQRQAEEGAFEVDSSSAEGQPNVAGGEAEAPPSTAASAVPQDFANQSTPASADRAVNVSFEDRFANETIDPDWAPNIKNVIETMISSAGVAYSTMETDCRTTVCRTVLTHDSSIPVADAEGARSASVNRAFQRSFLPLVEQELIQGGSVQTDLQLGTENPVRTTVIYIMRRMDDR